MQAEIEALQAQHGQSGGVIREVTIAPLKKDIVVELFGLAWVPYYAFKSGNDWRLIAGNK